jgi:hypothetical protein
MRLVIVLLSLVFQAAGQSDTAVPTKTAQVRSYTRKDGRVVQAYTRAAPGTGTAPRSTAARHAFQAQQPCPSTAGRTGACPGYVVDHVEPLACGGIDAPENMQWQSVAEAKAKDRWERSDCDRPATIPPSGLSSERSTRSPRAVLPQRGERRDYHADKRAPRSGSSLTADRRLGAPSGTSLRRKTFEHTGQMHIKRMAPPSGRIAR